MKTVHVPPTRCAEILRAAQSTAAGRGPWVDHLRASMTADEDKALRALLAKMPGWASYMTAFYWAMNADCGPITIED